MGCCSLQSYQQLKTSSFLPYTRNIQEDCSCCPNTPHRFWLRNGYKHQSCLELGVCDLNNFQKIFNRDSKRLCCPRPFPSTEVGVSTERFLPILHQLFPCKMLFSTNVWDRPRAFCCLLQRLQIRKLTFHIYKETSTNLYNNDSFKQHNFTRVKHYMSYIIGSKTTAKDGQFHLFDTRENQINVTNIHPARKDFKK